MFIEYLGPGFFNKGKIVKKAAFFLVFFISQQQISAQVYQTVKSNRIGFFVNLNNEVKCIRIDSVTEQADSVYYPLANIGVLDNGCYTPNGPSWIGKKVIVREDGYNLFFNRNNDTIKFRTNALLHESWIAYKLADSTVIIAEVAAIDTVSFLGQLDSVKTIEFKVYDKLMVQIIHPLNEMTVLLSKNFGFIRTFNFNLFPNLGPDDINDEPIQEFNLAGLSTPKLGIQNLTWFDVFDFQPGDEIHVLYESRNVGYHEITKSIEKFLERHDFSDSIVYKISLTKSINKDLVTEGFYNYINDTITLQVGKDSFFDKLPGETIILPNESFAYSMNNGSILTKTKPSEYNKIWPSNDSCWVNCCVDDCAPSYNYYKGLGGPYYQCDHVFDIGGIENSLVYYKKGQVTWGVPLIITKITEVPSQPIITVFPNPTTDKVWVRAPETGYPFIFELLNLNGQVLIHSKIISPSTSINVGKYGTGTFLYRLHNKDGNTINGKLVIE